MSQDREQNPVGNESLRKLLDIAFAFVDSMALKCAIELGIADIINSHGRPITLSEIASHFNSSSLDLTGLSRLMRVLVRKEIFTALNPHPDETLYWLTPTSRLILKDTHLDDQTSYAPMVMFLQHPQVLTPWNHLSCAIKEGGVAFEKAHNGSSIWEILSVDEEFNKVFQEGMASNAKNAFRSVALQYKDLFVDVETVVDVGGGIGAAVIEIVKAHPHIKGINFDLDHVIAIAPEFPGVTHVEGDMFKAIPSADVVILKSILHDWSDEDCVKILTNCRRAIPEKKGKVIVFEQLAQQELERGMDDIVYASDLLMMVHTGVGKERTEYECKILLENAGFLRHQLIKRPGLPAVIEGYPE